MIQVFTSLLSKFFKKKQTNIFEISKRKPKVKENENTLVTDHSIVIEAKEVMQQFKCRICLDQGETPDSAVCMPCKCSGSMKYVHVECLQAWIIQKKSLKCEICNYEYSVKWFKWAAQHNILDNPTLKKLQQGSNQQRQRRQQAQNEQNRVRHYQNLLRSFGKRKSLTVIQKLQCIFLISGIIICFVFAYSNNQSENWQQSKNSKQHQRVYFTSLISYCLTIIIAYFWISQSKGFEYTFQTNLNYFKTHLPSLQQNNIINLQQQEYIHDQHVEQNNSNSQMEIDIQQQNQQNEDSNHRGEININFQQNLNQLQQHQQQNQDIQNNDNQHINNQVDEIQQQQQNDLSLQSKPIQELHNDIEKQSNKIQESFENAKQKSFSSEISQNYKIIVFNKKKQGSGKIFNNRDDKMAKQNVSHIDSNQVINLGQEDLQNKLLDIQQSQACQQPFQNEQKKEILGFGSFKIDQNRKIIEFGESESSEETISEKQQIKGENKQNFDNEKQNNSLYRQHEENIPASYREEQQNKKGIDIKQQKLILKHKLKKQQSRQDVSKHENTFQIELNKQKTLPIQGDNDQKELQNSQQIQQNDNMQVPEESSSTNGQLKQIQNVVDNQGDCSGQQIYKEKSNIDHSQQLQEYQQQQMMCQNQVELIHFESNQSIEVQQDSIHQSRYQDQVIGLDTVDIKVIYSNEENVPSQKTFDQQSVRKHNHINDIKNDCNNNFIGENKRYTYIQQNYIIMEGQFVALFDTSTPYTSYTKPTLKKRGVKYSQIFKEFVERAQIKIKTISEENDNEIVFYTPMLDQQNFGYLSSIIIQELQSNIILKHTLCYANGNPYLIKDHQIKLLFTRCLNKINNILNSSTYVVNPRNGEISLKNALLFDKEQIQKFNESPLLAINPMLQLYYQQVQILKQYTKLILVVLEELPQIFNQYSDVSFLSFNQINLQLLRCKMWLTDKDTFDDMSEEMKEQIKKQSQITQRKDDLKILNEIEIIGDIQNIEQFNKGGFGIIQKCKLECIMNGKKEAKQFIIKIDRNDNNQVVKKVPHEINILQNYFLNKKINKIIFFIQKRKQLNDESNLFIARYYYSNQQKYQDILFMDIYQYKSLDILKLQFSQTMSLITKLYIMWQISQGIQFLTSKNISHLDLKPANIVISKGYLAKIIDFGEAYHPVVCNGNPNYKPGRTLPYTPYCDSRDRQTSYKNFDIFSFGMILSEIVFDTFPVDFKRGALEKLEQKFQRGEIRGRLTKNYQRHFGPKHVIDLIRCLVFRCIDEKENRPQIEWIILIVKTLQTQIEKIFSYHFPYK
ncbi:hypothetical protein ABPG74_014236 [Tetrahymena malaccensis]